MDIFKKLFTDTWPVANIRLTIDTDIPKCAYWYICWYFNKVFWSKLVRYSCNLQQPNFNKVD